MSTVSLIYKYPNLKAFFETNNNTNPTKHLDDYAVISDYLNPHANIIQYYYSQNYHADYNYYLSKHPSNKAVDIMMRDPSIINLDGLVRNTNPNILPLLERSLDLFTYDHWSWMSENSSNPTVMIFLENHFDKINWYSLSKNVCDDAIKILEKYQHKIVWCYLFANPSAIDIIKNNMDMIVWEMLCKNPNPEAISILEKNLDKVCFYYLSRNPNAIHILSQNLDKLDNCLCLFSQNPNALNILVNNPHLIDEYAITLNPGAISYLETRFRENMRYFTLLGHNTNGFSLIENMLKQGMVPDRYIIELYKNLIMNESFDSIYDLDYQAMSKIRSKIIRNELEQRVFHPDRVKKWIDYFCENGGDLDDFDWVE